MPFIMGAFAARVVVGRIPEQGADVECDRSDDEMECGWVKTPSGKGAEVKWNPQDKCVYWDGHFIGKASTTEEAVAKTRTWITERHIR